MTKQLTLFKKPKKEFSKNLTLDLSKKNDFAKFEIWEVLTFLTVVFTFSSIMVWFSSFYPQHNQQEFLFIDQQKNLIYNDFTEVSLKIQNQPNLLISKNYQNLDLEKENLPDRFFIKNDLKSLENNLNLLQEKQDQARQIQLKTQSQINFLKGSDYFINTLEKYQDYLLAEQQKQLNLKSASRQILDLRKAFLLLISRQDSEFQQGKENLEKIHSDSNFEKYFAENKIWQKVEKTVEELKLLEDKQQSKALDSFQQQATENLLHFLAFSQNDLMNLKKIDKNISSQDLINSLRKLENWQKEFSESNNILKNKAVFIIDYKHSP